MKSHSCSRLVLIKAGARCVMIFIFVSSEIYTSPLVKLGRILKFTYIFSRFAKKLL